MKLEYIFLFFTRRLYLFFYLLKKQFLRMFLSSLGLLMSLILIFSILGIIRPLKKFIVDQFENSIPVDTIIVKAPQQTKKTFSIMSLLRSRKDFSMGIQTGLVNRIAQWPEVKKVYKTQILQQPIAGKFDDPILSKMGMQFDILIQGVSYNLVKSNLKCMHNFRESYNISPDGDKIPVIPVLLPETFAEMAYAYTVMNGLPPVTKKNLIGLKLSINIGQSTFSAKKEEQAEANNYTTAVVCGFVPQNTVSVLGAPLEWVRKVHLKNHQHKAANSYDKLFIEIKNVRDFDITADKLRSEGLIVLSGENASYNMVTKWLSRLDLVLWVFVGILLVISAISLSNSFMIIATQKKFEFGLYLVFGASPFFLWLLIFIEGAFWGAFHSYLAYFISDHFSQALQKSLHLLPMMNEINTKDIILRFSMSNAEKWYLILGSIIFAGISSLIPTIIMTGKKTLSLVKKD